MTALRLRLFGPVQLWADGRAVNLGPARQRTVLAALAVDAGAPVSLDTLIGRVWHEDPPAGARSGLYSYLARIRRAIAGIDPRRQQLRLIHRSGGYQLDLDTDAVDLLRFRRLTRQARALSDLHERVVLLDQALELCAEPALADLTSPWAVSVRELVAQQRVDAVLAWAQALLSLDQPATVVAPLRELLAEHPLVEPLAARLMEALYRDARGAEALACFASMRERLIEELGTEPGPELRRVHEAILRDELATVSSPLAPTETRPVVEPEPAKPGSIPSVSMRSPSMASASISSPSMPSASMPTVPMPTVPMQTVPIHVMPMQLPMDLPVFAGRERELAALDQLAQRHADDAQRVNTVCALYGTAGVGKTALALHWAHRAGRLFPDGQLYVNLRGFDPGGQAMDPADALRWFLEALGVPAARIPVDLDARASLYRSRLAGRRMLIVADNARDTAQVRPLLPGTAGCFVLVTSRTQLAGLIATDGALPLPLELLSSGEAWTMLARRVGAGRSAGEPAAVEEIINRCARLPLALAVVAARAATRPHLPLASVVDEMRAAGGALAAIATGDDAYSDPRAVFSWSYQTLSPAAARLFRLYGVHPGPELTSAAAASLMATSETLARELLVELARANLIAETAPGRYSSHDLLRAYAVDLARREPDDRRTAAIQRLLDHYLHTAHRAAMLLRPLRQPIALPPAAPGVSPEPLADQQQARAWFTAERVVLLAAVDLAVTAGFDQHVWQLAWTLTHFLDFRGHWDEWIQVNRLAVAAARRANDEAAQNSALRALTVSYFNAGQNEPALAAGNEALALAVRTGDAVTEGIVHRTLSAIWEVHGQPAVALEHAHRSLAAFEAVGYRVGQVSTLNAIGWQHALLGDYDAALHWCQKALDLADDLGEDADKPHALDSLGYAHHHLGHFPEAIAYYQQAIDLHRLVDNRRGEGVTLIHLGDTYRDVGDRSAARQTWREAVRVLDDLDATRADEARARLSQV